MYAIPGSRDKFYPCTGGGEGAFISIKCWWRVNKINNEFNICLTRSLKEFESNIYNFP